MKKFIFSLLLAPVIMTSCGNREYAYNESAAANYYLVSNQLEEYYQKFIDGEYKTKFEYNNDEFVNSNPVAVAARNLKNNTATTKEHFNLLKPSVNAQAFHNKTLEYFNLVEGDFSNALQSYADLNCDCPAEKDSISLLIKNLYSRISTIEDQCLEEQKKYIEAIGMRGK